MTITPTAAIHVVLLCLTAPSHAAPERVAVGEALEQMTIDACRSAYPVDKELCARCKHEYFDERSHNHEYLWEEGDRGDRECLVAGGILRHKMPGCVEAMTRLMAADRDHDTSAFFQCIRSYCMYYPKVSC